MQDPSGSEPAPQDSLQVLRERVLRTALTLLGVALPLVSVLIWIQGGPSRITLVLGLYTLAFPALRLLMDRLGFRASALLLLLLLGLTCFFIGTRGGAAVGNVGLSLVLVLLSALFFGKRGALVGSAGILLAFALAGVMLMSGRLPPVDMAMWDPRTVRYWVRAATVLLLMALVVALTMNYVVERLTRQAEERIRAQAALEESRRVETLARLSGGIAHDFNNALTVIVGAADAARMRVTHPEAISCLDDVLQAALGAGELTRQLLTLGRRQVSKPEPVVLRPLLTRLETSIRRLLASDITIDLQIEGTDLSVFVDPIQLERSLYNLLLNARDAMPRGGRLDIRCRRETPRPFVSISVQDSGHGMDEATLAHIFEPFFTTKEVGRGTGLGLASVKAFAGQVGGDVRVVSEPGRGTTFTLELPEHEPNADEKPPVEPVEPRNRHSDKPVLVVEDRADVRASIVRTLSQGGFVVAEASDGDGAMAQLREPCSFALLCIDGVMPGTCTADVIEYANRVDPDLPVLLCSGHVQEDLVRRGIETGRYAFLEKPFSARQLLDKVQGLIDDRARVAELRT